MIAGRIRRLVTDEQWATLEPMLTVPIEPVGAGATGGPARHRLRLCYFESTAPQNICWAQPEQEASPWGCRCTSARGVSNSST